MAVANNVSILRLPRVDQQSQHILVQASKVGSKSLDLKLIATEHEHLYHAEIKESGVKGLQANSFGGDLSEWKAILRYALLHEKQDGQNQDSLGGLETVAAIAGKALTITLRKNIGGITQRLGDIKLQQDDEKEEVSAFEWVDSAVATADVMRAELENLLASMDEQRKQVASLTQQLEDLVRAKKEHEDELLSKFTALLNTKKLKIRDQQRLLAGAHIDPETAEAVGAARTGNERPRKSALSRNAKRKANATGESEDEVMDDHDEAEDQDEELQQQNETPPRSEDDVTEDEDDLDAGPDGVTANTRSHMDIDDSEELPPRRNWPFARNNAKSVAKTMADDDRDDDDTDDEL